MRLMCMLLALSILHPLSRRYFSMYVSLPISLAFWNPFQFFHESHKCINIGLHPFHRLPLSLPTRSAPIAPYHHLYKFKPVIPFLHSCTFETQLQSRLRSVILLFITQ